MCKPNNSGKKEYYYDESSNLIKELDSVLREKGKEITYEYDGLNRLIKIDYPDSADTIYTYGSPSERNNRAGRIIKIEDESGTIEYQYGELGEVIEEKRTIKRLSRSGGTTKSATMKYESDYLGRMQKITYPDGEEVTYGYDWGGQVISEKESKTGRKLPLRE